MRLRAADWIDFGVPFAGMVRNASSSWVARMAVRVRPLQQLGCSGLVAAAGVAAAIGEQPKPTNSD